ncbi:MAG: hypothetical protein AAGF79_06460 [Pseudomonadota bacterium]
MAFTGGRYLYLLQMSAPQERPGLIAVTDVSTGLLSMVLATVIGLFAHMHAATKPIVILFCMNAAAAVLVWHLIDASDQGAVAVT